MSENIVKRLQEAAERATDLQLPLMASVLSEAAAEIEYLRTQRDQLNQERRGRFESRIGNQGDKEPWGRSWA